MPGRGHETDVDPINPTADADACAINERADLRPFILWHECDTCHLPSAFFLDGYDRGTGECRMRAMDHNHSIRRRDVVAPLAKIGLLPPA